MTSTENGANKMWGGRFSTAPSDIMKKINPSISFDKRLFREDILGSRVHAEMLARQGIISDTDFDQISSGLDQVQREIESGSFTFSEALEDIHMNVESRLKEIVGEAAGRLHTARSRNDQAATDVRLWMMTAIRSLDGAVQSLQRHLIERASENLNTIMPGFTHMQVAQPVTFAHHLMAYVEMFGRDRERLAGALQRTSRCPLGSAALAGTAFPIDRHFTAEKLGFSAPTENSMDSVGSRDHIAEFLFSAAMLSINLSRLAEEITLWCSDGFRFISLSDAFTTGSSIMPQKRNPDAAELVRGKTGRVVGSLTGILVVLKGLPMTFMKDMQEDKEPLFDAFDTTHMCVEAITGMVVDMTVRSDQMRSFVERGFPTATDLADWLVREAGIPFRDAHHITAKIVAKAEEADCTLDKLALSTMQEVDSRVTEGALSVLTPEYSVSSRRSYGGTAPQVVGEAIERAAERWL